METLRKHHPFVMMEIFERNVPAMIRVMGKLGYQYENMEGANYLFY